MERIGIVLFGACLAVALAGYCPEGEPAHPQDVRAKGGNLSIFSDLTVEEMNGVLDYMYNRSGMRIATWARGTLNSSYIYVIEALPPRKAEALRYLDQRGPKPQRYAKVILYRGDQNPPHISELKVGPLPRPTMHEVMQNPHYKDDVIPFYLRNPISDMELPLWVAYIKQELNKIDDILKEATGGYSFSDDCGEKCLDWFPNFPGRWKSGTNMMFANFFKLLDAYYLHPIGLQIRVSAGDPDNVGKLDLNFLWFRGDSYFSVDEFRQAYDEKRVTITPVVDPENAHDRTLYSSMNFRGEPVPSTPRRGPQAFFPDGRRYTVDGNHVSWQNWEFDFGVKSIQGLHVDDVRFKDERVVYELGIQELGAFYSGDSPLSMHTSFFDTIVFIGREAYTLQRNIDCPEHATFFDMVHYLQGKAYVFKDSVCVFEQDMGVPLRRHYESDHKGGYHWVQGMQDNALVVRSIYVAYNYEYINDIIFHQQGGIETKITLSGYILATFFTDKSDTSRGFQMFPDGHGNIHHHLLQFKVDLDIKGTSNRFETYDIRNKQWDDLVDVGEKIYGNYFVRNLRQTEMDAQLQPEPNQHLIFFNEDEENQFGNKRGYRLQVPSASSILYPADWRMSRAGACFRNPVSVTKHKDHEQVSSLGYATVDPFDPVMSFEDFFLDDESIVDEDLVTWVTIGTIHIPHTEDVPVVTTQNTQLTFHLTPFNYHMEDPSLASRDNVRVERSAKYTSDAPTYDWLYAGVDSEKTCMPRKQGNGSGSGSGAPAQNIGQASMAVVAVGLVLTTMWF